VDELTENDIPGRIDNTATFAYGVNLHGATMRGVKLALADLYCADMSNASMQGAKLRWADMTGVDMRNATITNIKLTRKQLDYIATLKACEE
jgi:uncharacterized protein YjbI with pentapeptide repeats